MPRTTRRSVKSSSLEILEELPPDRGRFLVAALEAKDQLGAVFSHPYDHEDGYEFDAPADPHPEVDAVNKDVFDLLPGEVAHPPFLHRLLQLGRCIAHLRRRERSVDEPLREKREGPRAYAGQVHGCNVFGDPLIITLAPGEHLGVKIAVPITGHPDLYVTDAFNAKGTRIAAVAVIGAVLPLILLSSYMVGKFFSHKVRKKGPYLFLYVHADVLKNLCRDIFNFLD